MKKCKNCNWEYNDNEKSENNHCDHCGKDNTLEKIDLWSLNDEESPF